MNWVSPLTLVAPLALFGVLVVVALVRKLLKRPPPHPEEHPRNAWRQYHARYALLVLAFVVFDMEMAFMYPWAWRSDRKASSDLATCWCLSSSWVSR